MVSSHIIILRFFTEDLNISIPDDFLNNLSHIKFDGKGLEIILDCVVEFVQFFFFMWCFF